MSAGLIVLGLSILFMAGGLLAFWRNARHLPKNLPPPLKDDDQDRDADDSWR